MHYGRRIHQKIVRVDFEVQNTFVFFQLRSDTSFCGVAELDYLPWREWMCSNGDEFIMTAVFFAYCLCGAVFLLVGGLFWWNFSLISSGQTYIEFLVSCF